jgi:hypothetical protein
MRRNIETREVFVGKIDAAATGIFLHVANDVGELKGEAEFFGKIESARDL